MGFVCLFFFFFSPLSFCFIGSEPGGENHTISGPLGQSARTKKKRNPSVLATAFQNAWKQGNLTEAVSWEGGHW